MTTLDIKPGSWAVLRNGEVRGPLRITHTGSITPDNDCTNFWRSTGEYRTGEEWPADIIATLPGPPIERIRELEAENEGWQKNMREQFDALCAMRNDLNELFPIQHIEADLMSGPETSVFCAAVVEAARAAIAAYTAGSEPVHSDDMAVDRFANAMKAKLAKKRLEGRGGWEDKSRCSNAFLSKLLSDHVGKGDPVDVGNFAMMIHQRGEDISHMAGYSAALSQLHAVVDAWEVLPGGRQVQSRDVEKWLADNMAPAINSIRVFLNRPRPDGVMPATPQPAIPAGYVLVPEEPNMTMTMAGQNSVYSGGATSGPTPIRMTTGSFKTIYRAMIAAAKEKT